MKVTYLGHSAFWIEGGQTKILIDPFLSDNPKASAKPEAFDPEFIFLTHGHSDHVGDAPAIGKRAGATVVTTFELATYLGAQGLKTIPVNHGGWLKLPFGAVKFTVAFHSSSLIEEGGRPLYLGEAAGLVLELEGKYLYHAGDTALFSDMRLIGEDVPLELAMLPIGDHFTMGPKDAAKAVEFLQAKRAIPIHYGTFPPLIGDPKEFKRLASGSRTEILVLDPGQSLEF
ncbi:MAG TPA: metal-dependent hydrolase [Chthoniobacterales bacterium]